MTRTRLALLPFLVALVAGACISSSATPASPVVSSLAPVTAPPSRSAPPSSGFPSIAPAPATPTPTPEPTATPQPTPTETPPGASPSPSGSGAAAGVEGCTGNDDNRTFFAGAAAAYSWPVYCAVLPAHWFVNVGSRGGGKLDISYKGPNGARFELHEGAVCAAGVDCYPTGSDAGTADFGDRVASLIHVEDGGVVAIVDRGQRLSWMAIGQGMDDPTFVSLLGALIRLD